MLIRMWLYRISFVEKNGFDYALGTVYNGDNEIGQVVIIRKTP